MSDIKNQEKVNIQRAFWGTIFLDATLLLVYGFVLISLILGNHSLITYIAATVLLFSFTTTAISLFLTIREQQEIGFKLTFFSLLVVGITIASLFQGRTLSASFLFLVVFVIGVVWLAQRRSWRWYSVATVAALILIWGVEWINPTWRQPISVAQAGPIGAVVFVIVFIVFMLRQTWRGNIRTKLIVSYIIIAVSSVGIAAFSAQRSLSTSLTQSIGNNLSDLSNARAIEIGLAIDHEKDILEALSLNKAIQAAAALGTSNAASFSKADITRLDQQWRDADAANNDADPLVARVINNPIADELRSFRERFPENVEVFLTNEQGLSVASSNRTSDYLQADEEWWQVTYKNGTFIGQPEYDTSSKTIAIIIAVTIRENGNGRVLGVLRTTVNFSTLKDTLALGQFGKTGHTNIYLPGGQELKLNVKADGTTELVQMVAPETAEFIKSKEKYQEISLSGIPVLASTAPVRTIGDTRGSSTEVAKLNWYVVAIQDQAEALLPVNVQTRNIIILAAIIITAAAFAAIVLARLISGPIALLTKTAEAIAGGRTTLLATVESNDEIGTLAMAFNKMTQQLRDFIGTLEQRVVERTHSLEIAAEVGRSISQVRSLDVMLKDAAELIRLRYDLYYVQIYLVNPGQNSLLLQAGTGTVGAELVGRGHSLPLDINSINGRAAAEKHSVVISDTTIANETSNLFLYSRSKKMNQVGSDTSTSSIFRPNPLLPETRSEMAIPLIVDEKVVGVLDLQNNTTDSLNQSILPSFEALAGQLAIAIQNANLLAETNQARAEVEAQSRRLTRINWMDYLDAIHKPEETGFVFEQNKITPITRQSQLSTNGNALTAPIAVTGEHLGNLVVEMEGQLPIARADELINTVASQVAQQIENLRLLDSAERYRAEAEQASRRLTHEGWQDYMQANITDEGMNFIYDLNEVRPFNPAVDQQAEKSAFTLLIKVRDEVVGKLIVQGLEANDSESLDLAYSVAERLGAHIEGLRLSNQTEQALATTQKQAEREQALRQITSAVRGSTDPATILRTAVRELGTLLGRKTVIRLETAHETQASQTQRPADLAGEAIANNGHGSDSSADHSINAVGGNQ